MESKFLKEALFCGMSSNAFKLGTVLSLGWFWMRPAGCHNVYRGQDGNMDYDNICGVMSLEDEQVSLAGQALPANTIWHYIRRQVSHCGLESTDSPAAVVRIDSAGDMLKLSPNPPLALTAELLADGKVRLRWRYSRLGEEISPTGFNIYIDSGSGFDFDTPDAEVSYGGAGELSWTSGELVNGQLYKFAVRSYKTGEGETQNTNFVTAVPDSQGPPAITDIIASWEEE